MVCEDWHDQIYGAWGEGNTRIKVIPGEYTIYLDTFELKNNTAGIRQPIRVVFVLVLRSHAADAGSQPSKQLLDLPFLFSPPPGLNLLMSGPVWQLQGLFGWQVCDVEVHDVLNTCIE